MYHRKFGWGYTNTLSQNFTLRTDRAYAGTNARRRTVSGRIYKKRDFFQEFIGVFHTWPDFRITYLTLAFTVPQITKLLAKDGLFVLVRIDAQRCERGECLASIRKLCSFNYRKAWIVTMNHRGLNWIHKKITLQFRLLLFLIVPLLVLLENCRISYAHDRFWRRSHRFYTTLGV